MAKSFAKATLLVVTVFEEGVVVIKFEACLKVRVAIYLIPTIAYERFEPQFKLCLSAIVALLKKVKHIRRQVSELIFSHILRLSLLDL
jgi:hypothetical protein